MPKKTPSTEKAVIPASKQPQPKKQGKKKDKSVSTGVTASIRDFFMMLLNRLDHDNNKLRDANERSKTLVEQSKELVKLTSRTGN